MRTYPSNTSPTRERVNPLLALRAIVVKSHLPLALRSPSLRERVFRRYLRGAKGDHPRTLFLERSMAVVAPQPPASTLPPTSKLLMWR